MADVVTHYILNEEHGEEYTCYGIYKVWPVTTGDDESLCQEVGNLFDEPFKGQPCQCGKDSHQEADDQHELVVAEVAAPPTQKECQQFAE